MYRFRLGSWFIILMMLSGLVFIFSPNIVKATDSYSMDFDDYAAGDQVSESWMLTWSNDMPDNSVSSTLSQSGIYSYKTAKVQNDYVWFNFTNTDFESLSFWIRATSDDGDVTQHQMTFYNSTNNIMFNIGTQVKDSGWAQFTINNPASLVLFDDTYVFQDEWFRVSITKLSENTVNVSVFDADNVFFRGQTSGMNDVWSNWNGGFKVLHLDANSDYFYIDDLDYNGGPGAVGTADGNITINVYNESDPSVSIPDWTITISDEYDGIYYSKNNNDNPVTINYSVFGTGTRFFTIGASDYSNRTYYSDIRNGIQYNLDAFLPYDNHTNLYTLIVVDDYDLDAVVYINNAEVSVSRNINGTGHEVASGFTGYSGRLFVYLIPGESYTVNISAVGYYDSSSEYVPRGNVFEQTFHLTPTTPTTVSYDDFWENVIIDIDMASAGCLQDGNITITYLDSNSSTTNTEMQLWEVHGNNNTLLNTWGNTSSSFFNINGSINTTRMHYLVLFFNNTADFFLSQPVVISIPNVDIAGCDIIDPIDLDDRFSDVFGDIEIGDAIVPWSNFLSIIIPLIVLMSFGPFNTGIGIIGAGISMVMIRAFLDTLIIGGFNWAIIGSGVFIVIIGILYMMTKGTGGDKL